MNSYKYACSFFLESEESEVREAEVMKDRVMKGGIRHWEDGSGGGEATLN